MVTTGDKKRNKRGLVDEKKEMITVEK